MQFAFPLGKPHCLCPSLCKLHQSQLELQEVRLSYRQLQVKVEELNEERSLQSSAATSTSLLSEIEQSMEAEELEQEREQVLAPPPSGLGRGRGTPHPPAANLVGTLQTCQLEHCETDLTKVYLALHSPPTLTLGRTAKGQSVRAEPLPTRPHSSSFQEGISG